MKAIACLSRTQHVLTYRITQAITGFMAPICAPTLENHTPGTHLLIY